jgi:hypothetical protein
LVRARTSAGMIEIEAGGEAPMTLHAICMVVRWT